MEVKAVVVAERGVVERGFHRGDVGVVELDGLEIGEAPPDFAKAWRQLDGAAVGGNGLLLLADGFQQMREAHPDLGLVGMAAEHVAIKRDRFLIAADPAKRGGAEVAVRVGDLAARLPAGRAARAPRRRDAAR